MKGKTFLQVTGILMIIGGAIGLIASLGLGGLTTVLAVISGEYVDGLGTLFALVAIAVVFSIIGSVVELVAGIIGVKNCGKPEKAGVCLGWGIAVIVISVISNVLTIVGGSDFSVLNLILGLVLPVLYVVGAALNNSSADIA